MSEKEKRVEKSLQAVEEFLSRDGAMHDSEGRTGRFLFFDEKEQRSLNLQRSETGPGRVLRLGPGEVVACVEMRSFEGEPYDLDFVLQEDGRREPRVQRVMLHVAAGAPRYAWIEEGGVMTQKPIA
jgi:hypothetical protein